MAETGKVSGMARSFEYRGGESWEEGRSQGWSAKAGPFATFRREVSRYGVKEDSGGSLDVAKRCAFDWPIREGGPGAQAGQRDTDDRGTVHS